jgi:hypothetical protein
MHIQFDRDDPDSLAGFTFDNSDSDNEQMIDFLLWLDIQKLTYNKLKIKMPTSSEKVTCIIINKTIEKKTPKILFNDTLPRTDLIINELNNELKNVSESDIDSESESDNNIKTKKSTKKVVKK